MLVISITKYDSKEVIIFITNNFLFIIKLGKETSRLQVFLSRVFRVPLRLSASQLTDVIVQFER